MKRIIHNNATCQCHPHVITWRTMSHFRCHAMSHHVTCDMWPVSRVSYVTSCDICHLPRHMLRVTLSRMLHVTSCHVTSHDTLCHITLCHIMSIWHATCVTCWWIDVMSRVTYNIMSHIRCPVTYHVMSHVTCHRSQFHITCLILSVSHVTHVTHYVTFHMSRYISHRSCDLCHMLHITCHVTWHIIYHIMSHYVSFTFTYDVDHICYMSRVTCRVTHMTLICTSCHMWHGLCHFNQVRDMSRVTSYATCHIMSHHVTCHMSHHMSCHVRHVTWHELMCCDAWHVSQVTYSSRVTSYATCHDSYMHIPVT